MYDYSPQLEAFQDSQIRLPSSLLRTLYDHRKANRDRIISRLPERIEGLRVGNNHFKPQGSVAMETIIQTKFADEEYDIDDGLVLPKDKLIDAEGVALDSSQVREHLREVLKDARFKRQPEFMANCVRVFYALEDAEKHHVDFPVYRRSSDGFEVCRELAGADGWIESDPTQVNRWFKELIIERNAEETAGRRGTQLRVLVRLLKRFCRSREDWLELLPSGMKLTMLVAECQPAHDARLDRAFRALLEELEIRLTKSKVICNLAHPDRPELTRTKNDANVKALLEKIGEALGELVVLDQHDHQDLESVRKAWEWMFQSDGYFERHDAAIARMEVSEALTKADDANVFEVPWKQPVPWPQVGRARVRVVARRSMWNGGWRAFSSGTMLPKDISLEFEAQVSGVRGSREVYWQVVNTGKQAHVSKNLRGEIIPSGPKPRHQTLGIRSEGTRYTGRHWVEAFVVQHGQCLGRSGPFIVAIE